jgi:hypothetical protein
VLVTRLDPAIGQAIIRAALLRTPLFPAMLGRAYAPAFAGCFGSMANAADFVRAAEAGFRKTMTLYGQVMCQDEALAVQLLSEQYADLAEGFLGAPLPVSREETAALVAQLVGAAMQLCENDFAAEIQATA